MNTAADTLTAANIATMTARELRHAATLGRSYPAAPAVDFACCYDGIENYRSAVAAQWAFIRANCA